MQRDNRSAVGLGRRDVLGRIFGGTALGVVGSSLTGTGVAASTGSDAPRTVSAATTALTFIPGASESDGNSRDSAMPDFVDRMFHGDQRLELAADLGDALADTKHLPEFEGPEYETAEYPTYRVRNTIAVALPVDGDEVLLPDDGTGPEDLPAVSFSDRDLAPVTLEGEDGEDNPLRNVPHWFRGESEITDPWDVQESPVAGLWNRSESVEIDGVEGRRSAQIFGGEDIYIRIMAERYWESDNPAAYWRELGVDPVDPEDQLFGGVVQLSEIFRTLPKMYSFLELTVMADGSTVATLWDGCPYPRHALYVGDGADDGSKVGHTDFEKGDEYRLRENANPRFGAWAFEESTTFQTPYVDGTLGDASDPLAGHPYTDHWNLGTGPHPLVRDVVPGDRLTASQLRDATASPLFPFE